MSVGNVEKEFTVHALAGYIAENTSYLPIITPAQDKVYVRSPWDMDTHFYVFQAEFPDPCPRFKIIVQHKDSQYGQAVLYVNDLQKGFQASIGLGE